MRNLKMILIFTVLNFSIGAMGVYIRHNNSANADAKAKENQDMLNLIVGAAAGSKPSSTSGTGTNTPASTATFTIGGTVSVPGYGNVPLDIVFLNNGGDSLTVPNGIATPASFTFSTKLATGTAYNVTAPNPPTNNTCYGNPINNCVITNGSGTVGTSDITNISISCNDGC